jgi:hypothetical protein
MTLNAGASLPDGSVQHQRETLNSEPSAALYRLERHHKAFVKRLERAERGGDEEGAEKGGCDDSDTVGGSRVPAGPAGGGGGGGDRTAGGQATDRSDTAAQPWYIFFPDSSFRLAWDMFAGLLIVYIAVVTPLVLAFDEELVGEAGGDGNMGLLIVDVAIDCFFIFDIVLNFFTAVEQEESNYLITDLSLISSRYLES